MRLKLLLLVWLLTCGLGFGQVTVFNESVGTCCGTANTAIASTVFDNGALTFSGTGDTRTPIASTGYTGASGGRNVFLTNNGTSDFQIASINTTAYENLVLSFGAHKTTNASNMTELSVEYSTDGVNYFLIPFPAQPTGSGTANWRLISGINLPAAAEGVSNLRLRWTNTTTGSGTPQFRIDDIILQGDVVSTPAITISPLSIFGLDYMVGNGPSAEETFTVSGINLTNNIVLTAPANFEISTTSGGGFQNSVTLSPIGGTVNSTTLYIRLASSLGVSSYFGTLAANSTGAPTQNLSVSGSVNVFSIPCLNESFTSTIFPPTGWSFTGVSRSEDTFNFNSGPAAAVFGSNNGNLTTDQLAFPATLRFFLGRSGNETPKTFNVRVSTISQSGPFTTVATFNHSNVPAASYNEYTVDLTSVATEPAVWIQFEKVSGTTSPWRLDDIRVNCRPCTPATTPVTTNLASAPVGTIITISGSDFNANTEVTFNGANASIINQTPTELQVEVPFNSSSGDLTIFTPSPTIICPQSISFEVISNENNCQTNIVADDLYIYEIFDEPNDADGFGNGGMITLLNSTLEPINLSNYRLFRTRLFGVEPFFLVHAPSGVLNPGEIYNIKVNKSNCSDYGLASAEIVAGFNDNDGFELRKFNNSTNNYETIDQVIGPSFTGYSFVRDLGRPKPNAIYNASDWSFTNIYNPPSDLTTCIPIGFAPTLIGGLPEITSVSTDSNTCNEASITVNALEGYNETSTPADARQLNFQWFYFDGISGDWTEISTGGDFTIINTIDDSAGTGVSTIEIANTSNKENYQYYCRVREDDNSCFVATDAIRIITAQTIWNGTTWNPAPPAANTLAIIDGSYNTGVGGIQSSFSACNLIINSGTVNIANGDFIEVYNNVTVETNGEIIVQTKGAFIQRGIGVNAGTFNVNGSGLAQVNKLTSPLASVFSYTYWSSPVADADVDLALFFANPVRRFYFNANNFNSTLVPDIDDEGDDWTNATGTGIMIPGRGYAATQSSIGFVAGNQYQYEFVGAFNTGDISYPLAYNPINTDHWNLVGNPYPSAIDVDELFSANSSIKEAVYLWSHFRDPLASNPGNEVLNFNRNDYLVINETAELGNGSDLNNDGVVDGLDIPDRTIPSGQSFFVSSTSANPIVFNNAMRISGNNSNDDFYRSVGTSNTTERDNKLWINLNSDNGVYSQTVIGYVENATYGNDGMRYDARRNEAIENAAIIYTLINNDNSTKFAIQGRAKTDLNVNEIIPLGFKSNLNLPTIYTIKAIKFQGEFLENNAIYLKDNLLNITHNLTASDYLFTSEIGTFNNRFQIIFNRQSLSIGDENLTADGLSIIELPNGDVQFIVSQQHQIKEITIVDLMGRVVYQLKGNHHTETYNLSQLSKAAYIAKVTLANGQTLHKKAIKRF